MINKKLSDLERSEVNRLNDDIELIASENYPSQDILNLLGSYFSVKYAEGYPNKRHYAGCEFIDELEQYTIENAKKLFNCNFANVQPWSGSQANQAVYLALCKPGDTILGMDLSAGGHLTHGSKASSSGKQYNAVSYGLDENGVINYDEIKQKLYEYNPKILIVGASAYSRIIDFERIKKIIDEYNKIWENEIKNYFKRNDIETYNEETTITIASYKVDDNFWCSGFSISKNDNWESVYKKYKCYFMVDMAHIAGLVAAGVHPSPIPYADVVTTTTHKTLRGPRGGLILWNDENLTKKINAAVFPGIQGGPNEACIAAKCQCFIEAQQDSFKKYGKQILLNMQALLKGIKAADTKNMIKFVSGGSDNHVVLLDLKDAGISGKSAEDRLTSYKIITNKNMINDDKKPSECTGLRLGTAAITTRGFTEEMCYELGRLITDILTYDTNIDDTVTDVIAFETERFKQKVKDLLNKVGPFYNTSTIFGLSPDTIA